jgi:hypothetical protein
MASAQNWWVFKRPLLRDPLFVTALVLAVVGVVRVVARHERYGWLALLVSVAAMLPSTLLLVGITAGSFREYRNARRGA